MRRKRPRNKTNTASTRLLRFHGSFFSARFCSCIWRFVRPSWSSTCLQMRNGLISVDAYKKSRAFYIYERKLRYCIKVFFRVRKRASGNASMEKVLCVSVLVKFPRAETRAFLPQWKAALIYKLQILVCFREGGWGEVVLWIIKGTLLFLIQNNLSYFF